MAQPFNLTSCNFQEIEGWFTCSNTITNNVLAYGVLFVSFLIPFIIIFRTEQNIGKALIVSSTSSSVMGLLLALSGWISYPVAIIPLIILLLSFIAKQFI
jgi:hypothetical protein